MIRTDLDRFVPSTSGFNAFCVQLFTGGEINNAAETARESWLELL